MGKKKHTAFKNVMISLGCAAFAGVYGLAGCYAVHTFAEHNGGRVLPVWFERVETYVNGELEQTDSDERGIGSLGWQSAKSNKPPKDSEQETLFEEEETSEIETDDEDESTAASKKNTKNKEVESEEDESEQSTERGKKTEEETEEQETQDDTEELGKKEKRASVSLVETKGDSDKDSIIVSDVTAVVKAVMPSVVSVKNEYSAYDSWYDEMYEEEANASGIIVAQNEDELMIVTNYHVIEDYTSLYVTFIDGEEAEAYVKGVSVEEDLALLCVFMDDISDDTLENIAIAALGNSDNLEVGEATIAIGNALGYGQSVTTGVISAFSGELFAEDYFGGEHSSLIQTDAAINPGNSGGALLNVKGEVIGICEGKLADYVIEGMGYAIPISTAKPIIEELMELEAKKKVAVDEKGFLGISGTDVSEEATEKYDMPKGVFVSKVLKDTAAEEAGIIKGDIIISIDNEEVVHMTEIQNMLAYYAAGTKVEVIAMRQIDGEYEEYTFDVILGYKEN